MATITRIGSAERIFENYAFHSYTKDDYITESSRRKKTRRRLIAKQSNARSYVGHLTSWRQSGLYML